MSDCDNTIVLWWWQPSKTATGMASIPFESTACNILMRPSCRACYVEIATKRSLEMMLTTRQPQAATGGACLTCLFIFFIIISLQHHGVIMSCSCIRAGLPAGLSTLLNLFEPATPVRLLRLRLLISVR